MRGGDDGQLDTDLYLLSITSHTHKHNNNTVNITTVQDVWFAQALNNSSLDECNSTGTDMVKVATTLN